MLRLAKCLKYGAKGGNIDSTADVILSCNKKMRGQVWPHLCLKIKKDMERKDHRSPQDQQEARLHSRQDNEENQRENHQGIGRLQQQDKPLKNNDRDVDPEDPRHSSLEHR